MKNFVEQISIKFGGFYVIKMYLVQTVIPKKYKLGHIPFGFDSFCSLVHPLSQGYILVNRFLMEGYVGGISLYNIERVRFLPPLSLYFTACRILKNSAHYQDYLKF